MRASTDSTGQQTSVYLYYDEFGMLIYVGITGRGARRNFEHNATKDWWPFVARQEVEHYPTRGQALARERALIRDNAAPFNVQHNPWHAEVNAAYRGLRNTIAELGDAVDRVRSDRRVELRFLRMAPHGAHLITRLEDAPLVAMLALPSAKVRTNAGRATDFQRVGPLLTFRVRGPQMRQIVGGLMHLKFDSLKPVRFGVRSITVELADVEVA